ncbi:hypothetical protein TrCOL_g5678 [Triparma columacea]|uniref:CS domain-containing protein n=1 Tax=Triparma columacea TaxID=722753 RepID=A0A9W7GNI4_9STRA|nr:hypothetical protein TrCOL_g5678 [Triparma columacea]
MSELASSKDDLSADDRLKYLKDRGVEVETVEDRKNAKTSDNRLISQLASTEISEKGSNSQARDGTVEFAFIPQDTSKPIRKVYLPVDLASKPGDQLPSFVKSFFADGVSIDSNLLGDQATKQFASGQLKGMDQSVITASSMNKVAAAGSVETFPLVHPSDTNGFNGVYIYLDEVGMLKKLPNNSRATGIASNCGYHPPPNFYGDVFVGRVCTKPTMKNVPFEVGKDTAGGAEWMLKAVGENLSWQQEMNRVTNRGGETQPSNDGEDGKSKVEKGYEWTQDGEEVEVVVDSCPDKKLVKCSFRNDSLKVVYGGEEKVNLKLYAKVDVDGCTWTISGGKLVITMEKLEPSSWVRIVQ